MTRKTEDSDSREIRDVIEKLAAALTGLSGGGAGTNANGASAASGTSDANTRQPLLTEALTSNLQQGASELSATAKTLESSVKSLAGPLGSLGTLSPIMAGLMKLFGGGGTTESPELPRFERPASQRFLRGVAEQNGWALQETDYGYAGLPRGVEAARPAPQVLVQVEAMDSRSFLDHRDEIAAAVRQALLESHALGDVMSER